MNEKRGGKVTKELDMEWLQLILEAKILGIAKEEIQTFLQEQKVERNAFEQDKHYT